MPLTSWLRVNQEQLYSCQYDRFTVKAEYVFIKLLPTIENRTQCATDTKYNHVSKLFPALKTILLIVAYLTT